MLIRPNHVSCWRASLFAGLCSIIALYILFARGHISALQPFPFAGSASSVDYQTNLKSYWKELASSLEAARPVCPPINVTTEEMSDADKNFEPLKKKERPERLFLPAEDEAELIRAHRHMRVAARRLAPLLPVGDETGIVTTGGLKLFPVLLVSLRMLRRTGCTLPVQVFLGDQTEYKEVESICESVLPSLNAQCRVVEDIYSTADVALTPPEHFQFKILAILFSSFRHVLFLDADAFPAHDPTALFNVRRLSQIPNSS
jgi:alpha 1,2-mannosyltransferase